MFDGRGYAGYQAQTELPSVQTTLTDAVSSCLGFPCTVTGCSRTDAGVHALGFVCAVEPRGEHKDGWLTVPVGKVHRALAKYLPDDIAVCGEATADDSFHPRYSVKEKTYIYRMYDTPNADPFRRGRAWHLRSRLSDGDIGNMNAAGNALIGRHDFTSFMASGSKITDACRTLTALSVEREDGGDIVLSVSADGFLYNMVRIITGTLVDVALGTIDGEKIGSILASRDRRAAGRTAPAYALYLKNVVYDRDIRWTVL